MVYCSIEPRKLIGAGSYPGVKFRLPAKGDLGQVFQLESSIEIPGEGLAKGQFGSRIKKKKKKIVFGPTEEEKQGLKSGIVTYGCGKRQL